MRILRLLIKILTVAVTAVQFCVWTCYYSSPRSGCIISRYKHKLPSATRVVHFSPASWESGDEANLGVFVSTYLCRQESELALQLPLDRV